MQGLAWQTNSTHRGRPRWAGSCCRPALAALVLSAAAVLRPWPAHLDARPPADTTRQVALGPVIEPVEFDGVQPGVSTIAEVREAWGEPTETSEQTGVVHHVYAREPFQRLEVMFHKGKVLSIVVKLQVALPANDVAEQLRLGDAPVTICDDDGKVIGSSFPERGAAFRLAPSKKGNAAGPDGQRVDEVLLGEIDAEPFVLRAEGRLTSDDTRALADLEQALALDEKQGRAHWLRARVLANVGQRRQALEAVDRALGLDANQPEYKLTRARILADAGLFDEAAAEIEQAVAFCGSRPALKALALARHAELLATITRPDFQRCVEVAQRAIRLAEPLAGEGRLPVRRAAREALVEAHLAAAHAIAWGRWKSKPDAVGQWLAKAQAIAQASIDEQTLDADWGLRVCGRALGASVGAGGKIDPTPWARSALEIGRRRIEATGDPLHQRRLAWELGLAMYDALQTFQARREFDPALEYARLAVSYFDEGRAGRDEAPEEVYLLGRLYFRIGLIHAEHHHDHAQAVEWYEKAVPLIEQPLADSALADVGRQGESLVAAAVSFWQAGDRERAVRLTSQGAKFMEQAIEQELLSEQALAVVYSNLASMHRALGDKQEAERYALRATELERK